jgi:S1-C subfamily serine protease
MVLDFPALLTVGRRTGPINVASANVLVKIGGLKRNHIYRITPVKRTAFYCLISGVIGGLVAAALSRAPNLEPVSAAQEPLTAPAGQQGALAPFPSPPQPLNPAVRPQPAPVAAEFTPDEQVNIWVYEQVNRGVANITTEESNRGLLFDRVSEGEGSGSVLDREGHILTNFHVVDGARQIQVTLFDGKTYAARLVGQDPATDVAVIKIDAPASSLFPVTFGNSTQLRVGQRVFAIGNPFGLERTLTTGIIASLNRNNLLPSRQQGRFLKSVIQIDAAINPGNSGGPLLDSHARLIGMNTAIASKTGESAGVGFAIPVATIARVVPQLIREGKIRRPETGIVRVLPTDRGLLIVTLVPGGPAERAGLHGPKVTRQQRRQGPFVYEYQTVDRSAADLIVAVDGKPAKPADGFLDAIESHRPGEQVILTVVRGGQEVQVPLVLEAGE